MKKIFILTGEPSGDRLASAVVAKLKSQNPKIDYLSVGGTHIKKLGIETIFDLKEITYLGFSIVLLDIFDIKKKLIKLLRKLSNLILIFYLVLIVLILR